jgi:hypothetical protein
MGRIAAPFIAIALVYGFEELMVGTITEPELIRDNLKFFIDHQIAFGKAQLEAGGRSALARRLHRRRIAGLPRPRERDVRFPARERHGHV